MKNRTNLAVRSAMLEYGMPQWVLADLLDISETTFSRAFRYEWTEEAQKAVIDFIHGTRTDAHEVWQIVKAGGGKTHSCKPDGSLYPSQEKQYADRVIQQVEYIEAQEMLRRKGYL